MTLQKLNLTATTCCPYVADGGDVLKKTTFVESRAGPVYAPAYQICTVNERLENPDATAEVIAAALNADALLAATRTEDGAAATGHWLKTYLGLAAADPPPGHLNADQIDQAEWLSRFRDAQIETDRLLARHGVIILILEAARRLASTELEPAREPYRPPRKR